MFNSRSSVPFAHEAYGGFVQASGRLGLDEGFLVMELEVEDSNSSGLKLTLREVRIPLAEIEAVTFHRGWFRSKLVVRARTLRALAEIPGNQGGEVALRIRRRDRKRAARVSSDFATAVIDHQVSRVLADEFPGSR